MLAVQEPALKLIATCPSFRVDSARRGTISPVERRRTLASVANAL